MRDRRYRSNATCAALVIWRLSPLLLLLTDLPHGAAAALTQIAAAAR